ncbi:WAT1-related protein At5g40240-like isoform X2 [Andrographis paniculata]|uniref:WAT1-related protein At5g40240-like isoform X2 n=1 Tax=Andrographis paniculata TaxID=175694 RepID=UPI0021E73339|nr:WAT1-related protein At5g40240-like isoform X2 [Andrographis paniculata]
MASGGGGRFLYLRREVVPFVATVAAECSNVSVTIFYKAAVVKGLSYHVYMPYSYAISALLTLPLAYFCHRNQPLPPFTIGVFCRFCLLGVIGMEKVKVRSVSSQAKIIGTLVSITGALVVVLYEGPLLISSTHLPDLARLFPEASTTSSQSQANWIIGGSLLAAGFVLLSIWDILQAKFVKDYPAEFILVFWYNLSSFMVSLPVGFIGKPDLSAWKLSFDVKLLAILYAGIMGTGFGTLLHAWGLRVKGPVYVAMFKPLSIAIAAILGVIFLGDNLYLGCVVGSIVISIGFYTVMWGKIKEDMIGSSEECTGESSSSSSSCDGKVPLLINAANVQIL